MNVLSAGGGGEDRCWMLTFSWGRPIFLMRLHSGRSPDSWGGGSKGYFQKEETGKLPYMVLGI